MFRQKISYKNSTGSLHDPQFGFNVRYADIAPGSHVFELRNLPGPAYVDRFCLESAFTGASATSGPGATTSSLMVLAAGASTRQAVIERTLTQPGLYQVRAVNLGAGPQQVWTAATPWGPR